MKSYGNCALCDHVTDRDDHVLCIVKDSLCERQDVSFKKTKRRN